VMKSYISMLRCAHMLVFSEIMECLYTSIAKSYLCICIYIYIYIYIVDECFQARVERIHIFAAT
jgi:hypothetical protein